MYDNSWQALLDPGGGDVWFAAEPRPAFDPTTGAYSPANAWWLLEFARVVYRNGGTPTRQEILARAGYEEVEFISRGATQCMWLTAHSGDHAVLVFRGTSELRNWITNLNVMPRRWSGRGRIHQGFKAAYQRVAADVTRWVTACPVPVFVCGHSLGGALATVAAAALPTAVTYTYGSPRVGNADFVQALAEVPLFRVVNHRDLVTMVPAKDDVFGFRHAGVLQYIASDGEMWVEPTTERIRSDRRTGDGGDPDPSDVRSWYDPKDFLADHAPINYSAHLQRQLVE